MRHPWFVRRGLGYRPVRWQGAVVVLGVLAAGVVAFVRVDGGSHSASDTFYGVAPWWIACLAAGHALAWLTSDRGAPDERR